MKTLTVDVNQVFERQDCITCGCVFYIPQLMLNTLRKTKDNFYCPSGHSMAFIESTADRLKKQLEAKEADLAIKKQQLDFANNRIDELTRPKRRALRKAI